MQPTEGDKGSAPTDGAPETETRSQTSTQARYQAFMSKGPMSEDDTRLDLEAYSATIKPIDVKHRPLLHELTVNVFWPHRAHDLDLFLSLGHGYLAFDEIERPLASAMSFPMGDDFAMLGMMVTMLRLQAQGAGRRLLRRIMRDCEGRDLRLSATRSGYRLYESAGFIPDTTIWQQQGMVRPFQLPSQGAGLTVRDMEAKDHAALFDLDAYAFGADRRAALEVLLTLSTGVVIERGGTICGHALMRKFGKGTVIGPVIAEDDAMAMQLVAPLIQRCEGQFTRLDTPVQSETFKAFLAAAGMGVFDTVTEMRIGRFRRSETGGMIYGLAAHSLG